MKKLFVLPVFFLILFFIGCQENPITEPVAERSERSSPLISKEGIINLCCSVSDPLSGECSVVGKLFYIHEVTTTNNSIYATIDLTIDVNAELCPEAIQFGVLPWNIVNKTTHSFAVKNLQSLNTTFKGESEKQFTQLYTISNRNDIMLEIQFLVDLNELKITSIRTVKVFATLLTAE